MLLVIQFTWCSGQTAAVGFLLVVLNVIARLQ